MHEGRSKHCLRLLPAALLVEGPMANGLAQGRHHRHGKTATKDMHRKTEGHLVSIDLLAVDTTEDHPIMIIDRLHHRRQESDGRIGATARMLDKAISLHHLEKAAIHYQMYHVTVPMEVIEEGHLLWATFMYRATLMAYDDHGNLMRGNDVALGIRVIPGKALQMIGRIEIEPTVTESETDLVTLGTSVGTEEMVEQDHGVQSGEIGTATTATMTSIGGVSMHGDVNLTALEATRHELDSHLSEVAHIGSKGMCSVFTALWALYGCRIH
jgi:hypothetical protein